MIDPGPAWLQEENELFRADLKSATNSYRQLHESLNRLREWYNDSQAELQRTRNVLGDLLARITLGECPLCGAIPAQAHDGGCPVPKALEVWDGDPPELARWEEARERWRNDPGYGDNELSFINYLTDHGFEFEA